MFNITKNLKYFKKYLHNSTKLKLQNVKPIFPPPGLKLEYPTWETKYFLEKIGLGCE